ncbi:MAG: cell wall-active antibiotics response protein [Prevotellaceae bacterium]|jgi:predicted membrane protein|nr:cell wall-active antibiotics response protein [Prevotellaceae bacterium]
MKNQNFNKDWNVARGRHGGLWFGLLLIASGALFVLFHLNAIGQAWRPVILSWQMLLIVVGVVNLCKRNYFNGTFVVLVGAFFLLPKLAVAFPADFAWLPADFIRNLWGVLLILAGVLIVLNVCFGKKGQHSWQTKRWQTNTPEHEEGFVSRKVLFGGSDEIFLEPTFRGGDLQCVFGGIELDLRKTALPEGETILEIACVFGGIQIAVPDDWYIEFRVSNVLGGTSDSRCKDAEFDKTRKLIISGSCVCGGCEIWNGESGRYK